MIRVELTWELFLQMFKGSTYKNSFSYTAARRIYDNMVERNDVGCGVKIDEPLLDFMSYTEYKNEEDVWRYFDKEYYVSIEKMRDVTEIFKLDNGGYLIMDF